MSSLSRTFAFHPLPFTFAFYLLPFSDRLHPRYPVDGLDERPPRVALRCQDVRTGGREAVVAPAALPGLLDPAALDPAAFFEAIQQRIKGCDTERDGTARLRLDQLAQLVAVPRLRLQQREDQQLGASLLELAVEHGRFDIRHSDILLGRI